MENLAVFCADVGSIKRKNFGWAAVLPDGQEKLGSDIVCFAAEIASQMQRNAKIALGFECPLFVPVRADPMLVNSARRGEGNRSWSAGAGTGALATGLVEVLWVMNNVSRKLPKSPKVTFDWSEFLRTESVFLWEAFVTSSAKGVSHSQDARIAVSKFVASLPNPTNFDSIQESEVLSLAGAAALRAGWSDNVEVLSKSCLVIKA